MKKLFFICLLFATVEAYGQQPNENKWSGSAVVIGDFHLATNYHVVDGAQSLTISGSQSDYQTGLAVKIVAVDKTNDLAILKVDDQSFSGFSKPCYGFKIGSIDVGTSVFVLGYPLTNTMGSEVKLTTGVISSKTGFQGDPSIYQISAPIQPGNSGGPLLDNSGDLIGIVCAKHKGAEQVGYAIKLVYLQILIDSCGEKISFASSNTIANLSFTDKIKQISPFVYMVNACSSNDINVNIERNRTPDDADILESKKLFDTAKEFYKQKQYDKAFIAINKSVLLNPGTENHYLRAFCASKIKDNMAVVESAQYCIKKQHELIKCYGLLGNAYYNLKDYNLAIEAFDNRLRLDSRDISAIYRRGLCKYKLDDVNGALSDYKLAVQYDGVVRFRYYSRIYNEIAWLCFIENKDLDYAKENIKKSIEKNPLEGNHWSTYGAIMYKLGELQDCIKYMGVAITCATSDKSHWLDETYYYRGLANMQLGYEADALEDLQKAKLLGVEADVDSFIQKLMVGNNGKSAKYHNIYRNPDVARCRVRGLKVVAVESTHENTTIHFVLSSNYSECWLNRKTHIIESNSGKELPLIKANGIAIAPQKTSLNGSRYLSFTATFPAISSNCSTVDFSEGGDGWKVEGIRFRIE